MEPSLHKPTTVQSSRERTIRDLCAHFASDHLETEEFESRLERAYKATSVAQLAELTADLPSLPPAAGAAPAPQRARASASPVPLAAPGEIRERQAVVAIMGGTVRRGHWTPARQIFVAAVMGGVEIDLREARFAPGITEIVVLDFMGGVEIVVPPGLPVECGGVAIMGGFDHYGQAPAPADEEAPRLRIQGVAIMGGVEVQVRLPGESKRDAHKRAREERRQLREEHRRLR